MPSLKGIAGTASAALAAALLLCHALLPDGIAGVFHEKGDGGIRKPDVIWVPTPYPVIDKMLEMASIKRGDLLYDLGSGDGRIVITAAQKYRIRAVGYEIDPYLVEEAKMMVKDKGVDGLVRIVCADIYTLDLSAASVITLYLLPDMNLKLLPQLRRCRPGTRIVAYDFGIADTVPDRVERTAGGRIYLWKTPIRFEKRRPKGPGPWKNHR
ncbi:MAG: class I SAM-dependent methyltransferase [Spirochaetes bacterium]|nr:class I SAM-dependent methyltransferase [Spirochaetota bacterium]